MPAVKDNPPVQFLVRYGVCLVPILVLLVVYGLYYRTYLEFVESSPAKVMFLTGIKPANVITVEPRLLGEDAAAMNNAAYSARTIWSSLFFLHICISIAALVVGIYIMQQATRGYSARLPQIILIIFVFYTLAQIFIFANTGSYWVVKQLLNQTIAVAAYSPFPYITNFVFLLDKIGFVAASFLAIDAGLTLLKPASSTEPEHKHLAQQMDLLRLTLYAGTAVFITTTLMWSFTMRWAMVYIYPQNGYYYDSTLALANSQLIVRGIYFSVLLAATYLPAAAIQNWRASQIASIQKPKAPPIERANWLKDNGLGMTPLEFLPKLVAILGPMLAGSVTELFNLFQ